MPIYEYHCDNCNHDFEYLVIGKEQPECPLCKGKNVNKLISACGFLSKSSDGAVTRHAASDSSCTGCSATSCSSCGH